jgi:aromatic ring-cleaving dioxygenase
MLIWIAHLAQSIYKELPAMWEVPFVDELLAMFSIWLMLKKRGIEVMLDLFQALFCYTAVGLLMPSLRWL